MKPQPAALAFAASVCAVLIFADAGGAEPESPTMLPDLSLRRIDGTPEELSSYRGQVLLIVNVASKCGLTPQYEGLEALYDRYHERGLAVLGFPSNDFAGQEPGNNAEIADFCRSTYGVEFPMFEKLAVLGDAAHPLYGFLTQLPEPLGGPVQWNFQKYLVSREGEVVARFSPRVVPEDPEFVARVEAELDQGK